MKDVQNEADDRHIAIDKVGINALSYPITVQDRDKKAQVTVASINMYVDLPHCYRGTHMSRFIEVLSRHNLNLRLDNLEHILKDMLETFECENAHLEFSFPYFVNKTSPVSQLESLMGYQCTVYAKMKKGGSLELITSVKVPVHSLCPCSREISEYGAHNQRGEVYIQIKALQRVWFEELISIAERSASAPVYSLLKREDEKFVTELAYQNPKFVEDIAREVAIVLSADSRIKWYSVAVKNHESIHNHDAYAQISAG